ncbi:hypothetical protein QSJ19_09415 [Gordonia sp. ABSL11-1]|uniref:hypothetical protein n=1 Tax=Gordonia sp. ABSL11-1 TaxID=3053924 RepID=UPI00257270A5|nr:hypothetical protein [Gordonia sp. ABSL11-1]MDL9945802.1 hypothetical protein [Gordonia sp. ABSL11-1]
MAEMSDAQVAAVLDRAVAGINPVLDTLAERDPLGLKKHTFDDDPHEDSRLQHALHLLAEGLNLTDWPGTKGWSSRSMNSRADWWISRIGTVNTVAVAYPGLFGGWTRRLPLASVLGFANQAMVLVAVAREYGVTARAHQVQLLASVLCGRDVGHPRTDGTADKVLPTEGTSRKRTLVGTVWETAMTLRSLSNEFERRPQPVLPLRALAYIPIVGAPVMYVGEWFALSRAARLGRAWIADHPEAVRAS